MVYWRLALAYVNQVNHYRLHHERQIAVRLALVMQALSGSQPIHTNYCQSYLRGPSYGIWLLLPQSQIPRNTKHPASSEFPCLRDWKAAASAFIETVLLWRG